MRKIIAVLFVLAVASCSGDSTGPTVTVTGTWTLNTLNGGPLPVAIQAANPKVEILSGTLTLNADGTYSENENARLTQGTTVTTTTNPDFGTWVSSNGALAFRAQDGTLFNGSVSGSALTIIQAGIVAVYKK